MRERIQDFFYGIQDRFYDLWDRLSEFREKDGRGDRFHVPPALKKAAELFLFYVKKFRFILLAAALIVCAAAGFFAYNRSVTFDDYQIAASYENAVASGTDYRAVRKDILKYNSDGVTCVSRNNDTRWSITYSMQSPVVDVCDTTMVIAEQHGNQIYIVGKDGELGHFETDLPILKACVSEKGVVAAMVQEEEVTWIQLYRPDGTLIASDKTTITETGFPMAMDISPDGERMAVSYLGISEGVLSDTVAFYDFGSSRQEEKNNLVSEERFEGVTIPEVYYADNSHVVAVRDNGFVVFQGASKPKKGESVEFGEEILSTFHEDELIGFVFDNEDGSDLYRVELYNLRGKQLMQMNMDYNYSSIRIQNGQILVFNDKSCAAYTLSGHLRFSASYEKEVVDFYYFSEFRKYLVITPDSFDRITVKRGGDSDS